MIPLICAEIHAEVENYLRQRAKQIKYPDFHPPSIIETVNNDTLCDWSGLQAFYSFLGSVSLLSLMACLYVYIAIGEYRTVYGKLVMCNMVTTALVHVWFLCVYHGDILDTCMGLGYFGYYSNLSMFTWMTVMCYHLARTFYKSQIPTGAQNKKFLLYCCFGFGLPTIFSIGTGLCQVKLCILIYQSSFNKILILGVC